MAIKGGGKNTDKHPDIPSDMANKGKKGDPQAPTNAGATCIKNGTEKPTRGRKR